MNKSKIDWTEYTWNPITGCLRGCRYCYAKKQSLRFAGDVRLNLMDPRCIPGPQQGTYILDNPYITRKNRSLSFPFGFAPTLHRYRLDWPEKMLKGGNIFVGSMADMFGPWVPDEWLQPVFQSCERSSQHNYLFLTKYPERYGDLIQKGLLPKGENFWYGTTVTDSRTLYFSSEEYQTFLSIEPILEPLSFGPLLSSTENQSTAGVDWIIVGAETGRNTGKVTPEKGWIDQITAVCERYGIPIFMKGSLEPIMKDAGLRQEYPNTLTKHKSPRITSKLYEPCSFCLEPHKKSEMTAILSRKKRGQSAVRLGYACTDCLIKLKSEMHIEEDKNEKT